MEYQVVFEIASGGLGSLSFALPGLLFVGIGYLLIKNRERLSKNRPKWFVTAFSWFFFSFAVLWTLIAGLGIGVQQYQLRKSYAQGNFNIVEGAVENFDPMPYEGHKSETFTVDGVKFSYSDYQVTPGFNNATSHGGPIQEGLPVRISYIGNTIVKLEVAQTAPLHIIQEKSF